MKKILIDLGHPAHIHYFKHTISQLEDKGYKFKIIARDKEVLLDLLREYNITFVNRGKGKKSLFGKLCYTLYADLVVFWHSLFFRPNVYLSFASPYAAQVAWLMCKPHIAMDDTEHATLSRSMYAPFTKTILNPSFYKKKFSDKQIFFDSYTELFYLHPNYFSPDDTVLDKYKINEEKPYFILRLIAWNASHDIGHSGLNLEVTKKIVEKLSKIGTVLVSAESDNIDPYLKPFVININPSDFHNLLAFSSLYIGEGSTTAAECSVLGVTNILVNTLELSNIEEQEEIYGLSYHLKDNKNILELLDNLIDKDFNKHSNPERVRRLLSDKIDPTKFLVEFIEDYPNSANLK
jgi:predicted glycosyltransferase